MSMVMPRGSASDAVRHALPAVHGPIVGERAPETFRLPSAEEIARIRAEAHAAAHAEGFAAGRAKALAEGAQRTTREVQRLAKICDELAQPLARVDDAVVEQVGELAVMIARHLVRRELKHAPGEVVGVVREAMRLLPLSTRRARIHLHPDDLLIVQEALAVRSDTAWQLEADPLVSRGGCVVETEISRIDAQVESRIAAIASKMLGGERGADRER
jgi:flagellar assembly protein FliH